MASLISFGLSQIMPCCRGERGPGPVACALQTRLRHVRVGPFQRNERMLSLYPRYVVAFPGNGVLERLVIDAKARRVTVVEVICKVRYSK